MFQDKQFNLKRMIMLSFIIFILPLIFVSCYPDTGLNSTEDYDVVVTVYDKQKDFGALSTYALLDSIVHIEGSEEISRDYDEDILNQIDANMASRGYTKENDPETNGADMVIIVRAVKTRNHQVSGGWWPGWGWGYPGWGYPGYGWGYPWYSVTSYTTGTVFVTILDPNNPDNSNEEVPVLWYAGLNGLVSKSSSNNAARVKGSIDQAFRQSPYLRTN